MFLVPALFKRTFKIVMLGDNAVGKTSLLERYLGYGFSQEYIPTADVTIREREYVFPRYLVRLSLWDANGREALNQNAEYYCSNAQAFILVYDVCRPSSAAYVEEQFKRAVKTLGSTPAAWLVGNKVDLDNRKVDREKGESLARRLGVNYVEASAKTGRNVEALFTDVLIQLVKARLEDVEKLWRE